MDKRITDNVDSLHSRGAGKQIAELTDRENNLMLLVCPSEEMKESENVEIIISVEPARSRLVLVVKLERGFLYN